MAIPTYTPATTPVIGSSFSSQAVTINVYLFTLTTWINAWNSYLVATGLENSYISSQAIKSKQFYPQIFYFSWARGYTFINTLTMQAPSSIYANFVTAMEFVARYSTTTTVIITFSDAFVVLSGMLNVKNNTAGVSTITNLRVKVKDYTGTLIATIYQTQTFNYDIPAGATRCIPLFFVDNILAKPANITSYQFDFDILTNDLQIDLQGSYLAGHITNQYYT